MMGIKYEGQQEKYKIAVMAALLAPSCFLAYYMHAVAGTDVVFTHLFYIPIILVAFWWKRKALLVAIFLAVALILSHIILTPDLPVVSCCLRALMFIVVAIICKCQFIPPVFDFDKKEEKC